MSAIVAVIQPVIGLVMMLAAVALMMAYLRHADRLVREDADPYRMSDGWMVDHKGGWQVQR